MSKNKRKQKEIFLRIEDWLDEQCAICCSPMREWEDSPSTLNEHYAMEITILSCDHHFHKGCLAGSLEQNPECPLCRRTFKTVPDLQSLRIQRTQCRFRKCLSNPKTSCSRPEAPNNMGFCRVHLPRLPGLTDGPKSGAHWVELGNRKSLYILRDSINVNKLPRGEWETLLGASRDYLVENPHSDICAVLASERDTPMMSVLRNNT